tara:strand:+ start:328 stop:1068 length:741 start_codon:yes stop_codon:yes gene_type:complete
MVVQQMAIVDARDADEEEQRWIVELNTLHPAGYNLQTGGMPYSKGFGLCAESRQKISTQKKEQWQLGSFSGDDRGPHSVAAQAQLHSTLDKKRKQRLSGLTGRKLEIAKRNIVSGERKRKRDLTMRRAKKDPLEWKSWKDEQSKMTADDRKSQTMFIKRMEKMATMNPLDAALWMHEVRRSAMNTAQKNGKDFSKLERWYPNVLTVAEIRALQGNGGVWPSVPGLPASSANTGGEHVRCKWERFGA